MSVSAVRPRLVLLDIEGTTAPVAFVHDVLFPFARRALPRLLVEHADDPAVCAAVAEIARLAPDQAPIEVLNGWMDRDEKVGPLKALQGIAWRQGYESGALVGALYPDTLPALRAWQANGLRLAVYSSGSAAAQRLIYGHTTEGNVTGLFEGFFDLAVGGKKEASSYRVIAEQVALAPSEIVFFSDVVAELDAASAAGLLVAQIARPEDGTVPGSRYPVFADLPSAGRTFGLAA
ncbi:2,3-diketo-5-methylthio-1-phosphopentane phosphatase [Ameyamaea chiangmaiensis NBRC 103196]|uniref:Enolase-phosphatase E1 n=1 Tax=Ameyamaea chiangmaiensis TaxID=442969 RepID=A0A850PJF0_9PROT|nr:acireductone synthase [Ameyamaea chiangmaiensis]MBS4076443.1 acireductone synthase [Ameyamaea chiangmaiensis]NVN41411.1 acireductone synthase [Ameyamaea chiangmaiensis]GBQ61906.1 2,3-diketo-5-methylthio-1-phosphopentane phosphatase [Ameyamaea chiangmaiensis NBRC 103196]